MKKPIESIRAWLDACSIPGKRRIYPVSELHTAFLDWHLEAEGPFALPVSSVAFGKALVACGCDRIKAPDGLTYYAMPAVRGLGKIRAECTTINDANERYAKHDIDVSSADGERG